MLPPAAFEAALSLHSRTRRDLGSDTDRRRPAGPVATPPARGDGGDFRDPHVRTIRIHTRVPVAALDLVTDELIGALKTRRPRHGSPFTPTIRAN